MSSDLFSQITYQLDSDFFAHIPIHHDSDKLIAQVKQLLQHAICIDHKKILSDETCGIFKIQTPQEAIAIFAANSISSELLFPKILSLAEAEDYNNNYTQEDRGADDWIEEQYEQYQLEAQQLKEDIEYEINEHRINDGPDPTFDGTYQIGSDDPPDDDDDDDDGYVGEYDGESDSEDEDEDQDQDQDQDQDDYFQEEDE